MRVDWKQSLEGLSVIQIRDILRRPHFCDSAFTVKLLEDGLAKLDPTEPKRNREARAERLLRGLVSSALVQPGSKIGQFVLTDSGVSLRAARATKRITRQRADNAVQALIARAVEINADPIYLHDVVEVAVFGSYLDAAQSDLGDIDVSVRLKGRWKIEPGGLGLRSLDWERRVAAFEKRHPPPPSFYEKSIWRFWPEAYTTRSLRTDPAMVIVEPSNLESMGCAYRVIFPKARNVPAEPGWSCDRHEIILRAGESL